MNMDLQKTLDLRKEKVLNLKKEKNILDQKAQVVLCLDYSGSMRNLYQDGSVQALVERLLPLGLAFDDNGEVDFYLFSDDVEKVKPNITLENIAGYIQNHVYNGNYDMGGTSYAPVINQVVEDFANIQTKGGFLGFGGEKVYEKMEMPTYVIFITDGENGDRGDAIEAITEASKAGIFFQFVGIGGASFNFLKKLDTISGRNIDNANFFEVHDLSHKTDDELYALLLNEFPFFITEARSKNMIN